MKITEKKIKDLVAADYNPRQLSEKEYADLKASLKIFGLVDPIIVNAHKQRKNIIIGGHQRLRIWAEMGNKKVPCVMLDLPLEKERELNVRLNKNTGGWDWDKLANHFDNSDLQDWGFTEKDNIYKLEDLDIEMVDSINEETNFIVVCNNLDEMGRLKAMLKVQGRTITYENFIKKLK